jgi:hypothetical protein
MWTDNIQQRALGSPGACLPSIGLPSIGVLGAGLLNAGLPSADFRSARLAPQLNAEPIHGWASNVLPVTPRLAGPSNAM